MTSDGAAIASYDPLPTGTICPDCAYDLRGSTSERCPECGQDLAPLHNVQLMIPWEYRDQLGNLWAYLVTIAVVFQAKGRFCRAVSMPVSRSAAERFRLITAVVQSVWIALLLTVLFSTKRDTSVYELSLWLWGSLAAWITLSLSLYWLPGLLSFAFQSSKHSPLHRERAMSISLYGWCTLHMLLVPATFALAFTKNPESLDWSVKSLWGVGLGWLLFVLGLISLPKLFCDALYAIKHNERPHERALPITFYLWCVLVILFGPATLVLVFLMWNDRMFMPGLIVVGGCWLLVAVIDLINRALWASWQLLREGLLLRVLRLFWYSVLGLVLVALFAIVGMSPLYLAIVINSLW